MKIFLAGFPGCVNLLCVLGGTTARCGIRRGGLYPFLRGRKIEKTAAREMSENEPQIGAR